MMENETGFIGPVNMGNPEEFTIKQLAEKILAMIPESKSRLVFKPLPSDDPTQRKPDISRAKAELDWAPTVELKDGLEKTIVYFQSLLSGRLSDPTGCLENSR